MGKRSYYWTLSPIGLPSSPEWLDFERTWFTGLPTLSMRVHNENTHRTPLEPPDQVNINASISSADSANTIYVIKATHPMVTDPLGRFTTWGGQSSVQR